jgi:hypothetical protein
MAPISPGARVRGTFGCQHHRSLWPIALPYSTEQEIWTDAGYACSKSQFPLLIISFQVSISKMFGDVAQCSLIFFAVILSFSAGNLFETLDSNK